MYAYKIKKKVVVQGFWIILVLLITVKTGLAVSMTPQQVGGNPNMQLQRLMQDMDAQEIIAIDVINRRYKERRATLEQTLRDAQITFNQQLNLTVGESTIREAFAPVTKAIEDIAVNEIMMTNEINNILTTHSNKKSQGHAKLVTESPN